MFLAAQAIPVGYDIVQYRDIRFEFSPEEAERYLGTTQTITFVGPRRN